MDHRLGRACPLWKGWNVVAEGGVVDLVDKDTEESHGFIVRVLLELGVDLDDECGGNGGEQTSLLPCQYASTKTSCETNEDQSGVQIFIVLLHELPVVLLSLPMVIFEESSPMIPFGE